MGIFAKYIDNDGKQLSFLFSPLLWLHSENLMLNVHGGRRTLARP
jgi:hypothetical protein